MRDYSYQACYLVNKNLISAQSLVGRCFRSHLLRANSKEECFIQSGYLIMYRREGHFILKYRRVECSLRSLWSCGYIF